MAEWIVIEIDGKIASVAGDYRKRVELMFPIEDPALQNRVIASLQDELNDNVKAWEMKKSGKYRRVKREEPLLNSQEARILGPAEVAAPVE